MRLQRYSRSTLVGFQWVDQGQIGRHHFLPRRWNLYVLACVLSARFTRQIHGKNIYPSNTTLMKIYTYYTNKRIALEGQGRKLRCLRRGWEDNFRIAQIYNCMDYNVWTTLCAGAGKGDDNGTIENFNLSFLDGITNVKDSSASIVNVER